MVCARSSASYHIQESGTFRYQTSDPGCLVTNLDGDGGPDPFPVIHPKGDEDDTRVFKSPGTVSVEVRRLYSGQTCHLQMKSATTGEVLADKDIAKGAGPVTLDSNGRERAYIVQPYCGLRITAAG